jgi:hypothetical protein
MFKNNKDNDEDKNDDFRRNKIDKMEEEVNNLISFAKDSEKIYLSYIKYTNRIQEDFIEIKKKNLNEIQSLEIQLGEKIKNCLNKYYILQSNYCKNLNFETEKKIKLLEDVDINNDISIYIKNNRTNEIPPFKFDYVPYICKLDKQNNNNDETIKDINLKVKEKITQLFPEEKDISALKTKTDKEIENFIDSILNGEKENVINANEENLKIISNKNLRRLFLKQLNKLRNNTHIILNDISYKIIGNLLKECITHSYKDKDYISIKLIMVISTNLFKINKISNRPRIFLHNFLINNQIWKDYYFWESLIKYDIIEEMHNQKKYNLFLEENDVLKNLRIKDIVKSQLNTNIYNMITLEVNTSLMNKIINYFSNYYKLQKNVIESLNKIINNYKSRKIELKEKKKLNNSFDSLMNQSTNNNTKNSSKKNVSLEKDSKSQKNNNIIEPVKQDEQKIHDYFTQIDKEIKKNNIFKDGNFNNIIIKESQNKNSLNKETLDKTENNEK